MAVTQLPRFILLGNSGTGKSFMPNSFGRMEQFHLPDLDRRLRSIIDYARKKQGVHTINHMSGAGFQYSGENAAKCNDCGLEVTDWKSDMSPFHVHAERSPDCPFIRKTRAPPVPKPLASSSSSSHLPSNSSTTLIRTASSLSEDSENPSKRQRTELADTESLLKSLLETESLMRIRRRTFSHWTASIPSSAQMIEAGFFNCNVGDRVICIYCNLICQQWTAHTDDPCEVHKTLSPICIYVKSKLMRPAVANILIVNDRATSTAAGTHSPASSSSDALRSHEIVYTAACHPAYTELPKRQASYQKWISDKLPPVDELVRAGFFYTGTNTIVTCFYCNGSLQNWGPKDNPMIEHARWFPHCPYAKQLCGDDLYRKIQESKRAQQERVKAIEQKEKGSSIALIPNNTTANSRQLQIPDESTLSRLVAARLDLPVSQGLLDRKFKLSIIKRCWEDQLRLKHDDFVSESDLFVACTILQKQIEHIDGKKENIVIPSVRMKQIREQNAREQSSNANQPIANPVGDVEMTTSQSSTNDSSSSTDSTTKPPASEKPSDNKSIKSATTSAPEKPTEPVVVNPCVLCLTEEKRLACIPCGHLATCVPCGHSLRSCPMCRREIEAFVRIYI